MSNHLFILALAATLGLPLHASAEGAKKIQDNSFLVEEAYNQEAGVVQHIQSFMYLKQSKEWAYSFTQEWPVPDETHQLSYTIPVLRTPDPGASTGVGDILLNYRYQAVANERVAFAPRLSIIAPTGDYKNGHGTGATGIQVNLPLSVELSDTVVTHWNLGGTYTPKSKEPGGARADTVGSNYGASLIYLMTPNFNLMLEAAGANFQVVQPDGNTQREKTMFINPGFRYAANFDSGLQVVSGVSRPIGVGSSSGTQGVLVYLSLEHPFK
ncbi:transporter [Aromatoleum evansii]|uniref:transporter n=1 Tax=Aromatoleum evansii TaxID=59406 RepID=UPI00145C780B|nr:transporter [Aromatoleum evansii]NMG29947.1 transporter [Aromatoleum evansii]